MAGIQVEDFACPEVAAEPPEAAEEAVGIAERMGLSGQMRFVKKDGANMPKRSPYRLATIEERWVYRWHCPVETPVESYSASPIPLRVLHMLERAKQEVDFAKIDVWDHETPLVKDPVLVGYQKPEPGRSNGADRVVLIARWGAELETYTVMAQKAVAEWVAMSKSQAKTAIEELEKHLSKIEKMGLGDIANRMAWRVGRETGIVCYTV